MKKKVQKRRPGILLRFYPQDIARLSSIVAKVAQPRENWMRQKILAAITEAERQWEVNNPPLPFHRDQKPATKPRAQKASKK